jgi:hypothetical protein
VSALLLAVNSVAIAGALELANPGGGLASHFQVYREKVLGLVQGASQEPV